MRSTTLLGSVALALLGSCTKGDKEASYLQLGTVSVVTDPLTEGTGSNRITDLWVFVDDKALGVWESGSRLPVLREGPVVIKLIAGIPRNGIRDDRIQYPFYDTWSGAVDLTKGATVRIDPAFTYFPGNVYWIEGFEDPGFKFTRSADSDTTMVLVNDPALVLTGNGAGLIHVDPARPYVRMVSSDAFTPNGAVFLEIDRRSDHRFLIGGLMDPSGGGSPIDLPYLYVAPTLRDDGGMPWSKIHVDLSSLFNAPGITNRRFYIEVQLVDGATSGTIYLDDLKVVHR
ncbi:MAG: hypothetical protein IPM49_04895 [Flavobacteriales bacterium]|nr:hypothetical protein [Flavobacteriales bacterium]